VKYQLQQSAKRSRLWRRFGPTDSAWS
jgi:hypothetical protein